VNSVIVHFLGGQYCVFFTSLQELFNNQSQFLIFVLVFTIAEIVRKAGGKIYAEPGESQGWMYAFGFEDLDGHRWSMLYMDISKMPGSIK
jgi:hypothetical protein